MMTFALHGEGAQDKAGCKDSPIVSRFPGNYIADCKDSADEAFTFQQLPGKPDKKAEGEFHFLSYQPPPHGPSKAEVLRNVMTAVRNAGFELIGNRTVAISPAIWAKCTFAKT